MGGRVDAVAGESSGTQAADTAAVDGDVANAGTSTSAASSVQPAALSVKQDLSRIRQTVADFCENANTADANNESVNVETESDYEKSDDSDDDADESTPEKLDKTSVPDISERIPAAGDDESGDLSLNAETPSTSKRRNSKLSGGNKKRKSVDESNDGEDKRVRFAQSETTEIESDGKKYWNLTDSLVLRDIGFGAFDSFKPAVSQNCLFVFLPTVQFTVQQLLNGELLCLSRERFKSDFRHLSYGELL
jgi:hypothetical protein